MAEIAPITFALHGFEQAQCILMQASFANASKWSPPWEPTESLESARVVIVYLASETDLGIYDELAQSLPAAEIVAFSAVKPQQAKWHLERQPNGKAPIVKFNQLVLKISHSIKKQVAEPTLSHENKVLAEKAPEKMVEIMRADEPVTADLGQEDDVLPFFNILDNLLDTKPVEKRKKFNEAN